ncbi:RNA-directed DNA polymerase, eukaryota, reverse transcriptase zinc-binding domain protein [Tanacetum coccineum]
MQGVDDDNGEREIRTYKEMSNGSMRSEEEDSAGEKRCNAQEEWEANSSGIGNDSCTPANSNTDNVINTHSEKFAKESNESTSSDNDKHALYAQTVTKSLIDDGNKLFTIPIRVNSKGKELVLFDKELVREGYGLKDIVVDADEMCFFKFKDEDGMKYIIDQSPWIVNGKPLIVQKWDPEVVIEKETPSKPISEKSEVNQEASVKGNKDSEGFVEIRNRKNKHGVKVGMNNGIQGKVGETSNGNKREGNMKNNGNISPPSLEKIWNVGPKNIIEMRKSANKYVVRSEERNDEEFEGNLYFKYKWDAVNRGDVSSDEEDIIEEFNAASDLVADEIEGGDSQLLN